MLVAFKLNGLRTTDIRPVTMAQLTKVVDQGWKKIANNWTIGPRVKKYQNINDLKRNKIEVSRW